MNISEVNLTDELRALKFTGNDKRKHAWYSIKQHQHFMSKKDKGEEQNKKGLPIWVNSAGVKKTCTVVSSTIDHGCKFDDMIYLGVVENWCGTQNF